MTAGSHDDKPERIDRHRLVLHLLATAPEMATGTTISPHGWEKRWTAEAESPY